MSTLETEESNQWRKLTKYLSQFSVGLAVNRTALIWFVGGVTNKATSVDAYRQLLTDTEYLEHGVPVRLPSGETITVYKILKKVPADLNYSKTRRELMKKRFSNTSK